jgi:hypothetical protein
MVATPEACIGMGWYTPATWRELRAIPEAKIEMTYSALMRKCERSIAEFRAQGVQVVKIPINVSQMVEWCRKHGYEIDTRGRAAFGAAWMTAHNSGRDVMAMPFEDRTRMVQ